MNFINDDEINSITKFEILQDFSEEDIEQCEF
jgi:hypothetical protein